LLRDRNADVILRPKSANTIVTYYINYGTYQQNNTTFSFPYKTPLSLASLDTFGSVNIANIASNNLRLHFRLLRDISVDVV